MWNKPHFCLGIFNVLRMVFVIVNPSISSAFHPHPPSHAGAPEMAPVPLTSLEVAPHGIFIIQQFHHSDGLAANSSIPADGPTIFGEILFWVFQHPTDSQWTLISPSMSILCEVLLAVKSRMCFAVMQICGTYVGPTVLGTLCAVSVRVVDFVD